MFPEKDELLRTKVRDRVNTTGRMAAWFGVIDVMREMNLGEGHIRLVSYCLSRKIQDPALYRRLGTDVNNKLETQSIIEHHP